MKSGTLALAALILAGCQTTSNSEEVRGSSKSRNGGLFNIELGVRGLDEDDWAPVEDQGVFGLSYASPSPGELGFELGLVGSSAEDDTVLGDPTGTVSEFYGGVRLDLGEPGGRVRPFLGAGLSSATGEIEAFGISVDDTSLGAYVHGGFVAYLGRSFLMGLDVRALTGTELEFGAAELDVDYLQFALLLAFDV